MSIEEIPDIVIGRLPVYLRALTQLSQEGREVTSSRELGQHLGISSAQIRKDLSHFGGFGKQGTGYHVETLRQKLRQILHVEQQWPIVIVGAGDLGHAIAHYRGFHPRGFKVVAVFDKSPQKTGEVIHNGTQISIYPMENLQEVIREQGIKIAMIAVPAEAAQEVADKLVIAGVRGILNYAPIHLNVPENIYVQYIDPVIELQHMTFYIGEQEVP